MLIEFNFVFDFTSIDIGAIGFILFAFAFVYHLELEDLKRNAKTRVGPKGKSFVHGLQSRVVDFKKEIEKSRGRLTVKKK